MKKIDTKKALLFVLLSGSPAAYADEAGIGRDNNDPDSAPPETTTESCTSSLECTWQELLDVFEIGAE